MPYTNKLRVQQDYERGRLAVDVYKPKDERGVGRWKLTLSGDDEATGLKAQAYKSLTTGEVVIAFGGTDSLGNGFGKDLLADLGFVFGYLQKQLRAGLDFCAEVIDIEVQSGRYQGIAKEDVLKNISLAGHSLGGGIAQLAGYIFGIDGTTMDAPGTEYIRESGGFQRYVQGLPAHYSKLVQDELGEKGVFTCFIEDGSLISAVGGDHHGTKEVMNNVDNFPSTFASIMGKIVGSAIPGVRLLTAFIVMHDTLFEQHEKTEMLTSLAQRCGCDIDSSKASG